MIDLAIRNAQLLKGKADPDVISYINTPEPLVLKMCRDNDGIWHVGLVFTIVKKSLVFDRDCTVTAIQPSVSMLSDDDINY